MKKIMVIGCGGAGKSILSIRLGETLSIPVHHLDCMFWKPGWVHVERDEFVKLQNEILADDHWIIDGNYSGTIDIRLENADTIIMLDFSTIACLWGVITRYFKYKNTNRPDMTKGNNERITLEFLMYVWSFRKVKRPVLKQKLNQLDDSKKVIILHNRKEVSNFLDDITIRLNQK